MLLPESPSLKPSIISSSKDPNLIIRESDSCIEVRRDLKALMLGEFHLLIQLLLNHLKMEFLPSLLSSIMSTQLKILDSQSLFLSPISQANHFSSLPKTNTPNSKKTSLPLIQPLNINQVQNSPLKEKASANRDLHQNKVMQVYGIETHQDSVDIAVEQDRDKEVCVLFVGETVTAPMSIFDFSYYINTNNIEFNECIDKNNKIDQIYSQRNVRCPIILYISSKAYESLHYSP